MDYVRLGRTGLKVSRIGLGMMSYGDPAAQSWALPEDQAEPIVRRAVQLGVTFFDTADMYSDGASEVITGRLLTRLFARLCTVLLFVFLQTRAWPGSLINVIREVLIGCALLLAAVVGSLTIRLGP